MKDYFSYDERLGISIPILEKEWEEYSKETRQLILLYWEKIRGKIPDRIAILEKWINSKQEKLNDESDFERCCELNHDIAELASIINDLWIWYRINQDISKIHH
ncbi:hypothetical protein H1Z61_12675 [Bacillus aquiflavi]|uniref:Radical SAM protein n=1 Tax=Bacillus aquiflavi TaxID=2672567 RepID=A0A6B3VY39_9BACI|nr:hypothetical protein [Bacillus aquiflavi]MBA4537962.1 hypothetical protein [Bacillus aquiflavi]NEY82218.1 hypothetical protein [Bacillus aquiflavi]UAC47558.1 hypothetical protein K6959_12865 [Bacillus aquiflavi]